MKKILVIAFRFAPSAASGTFRSLGFVRHLSEKGWLLQVLSICEHTIDNPDISLLDKVPQSVKIIRATVFDPFHFWEKVRRRPAKVVSSSDSSVEVDVNDMSAVKKISVKEIISHFLKTPDNQIGWFFPAVFKIIKLTKPSLVYSSAPPFTGHLIAVVFKKIWHIPLVCDFRDPWLDNPFRKKRPGWVERWEQLLEKWVYKNATIVIANTEPMAEVFKQRHPEAASRIHVITNGYDPDDFFDVNEVRDVSSEQCLFVHPGSLYGQRDPLSFLEAVKGAIFDYGCSQMKVQLVGPSENFEGQTLIEHVCRMGLQNHVDVIDSIPHKQALERMKGSDYLLLFSQGTNMQVPAKIYEYMGLNKAIFAITETDSATGHIMDTLGHRHFSTVNEVTQITRALINAYTKWSGEKDSCGDVSTDNTCKYLRSELTAQLEILFLNAIEKSAKR